MSIYVVDTNFFIQAHRVFYPLDVVPSFWNKVRDLASSGTIVSIDKVKDEIYQNDDELKDWCINNLPKQFFKDSTHTIHSYSRIVNWAHNRRNHFQQRAIDEFMAADEADAWLIAYCLEHRFPIVTYEISQPNRRNKIKIPDVCLDFNITFLNTIDLFRQLRESI